ncbi:hypothetical protein GCM10011409_22160 [Lentibacillus populi]|uniref:Uncharacterized protein n=1 Tax=Lentibacillus populi TaxID=1827502 RepID=A0A9W5X629_9BACI|nr:hypothetical protein GCM10011409_22160 [Lentibacillus populi]
MKGFIIALLVYIVICVIAVLIPVSEGYNDIGWKLFVGKYMQSLRSLLQSLSFSL